MTENLVKADRQLFLFFNGNHSPAMDVFFGLVSAPLFWIPVYVILLWLVISLYKKQAWVVVTFVALLVAITDLTAFHLFKETICRLRPCHEPALGGLVHIVDGNCGGMYGFVSNHAANYFGIATFLSLLFRRKYKAAPYLLLLWAVLIAYSRIYLGVHYPGDVAAGALLGMVCGTCIYLLFIKVWPGIEKKLCKKPSDQGRAV